MPNKRNPVRIMECRECGRPTRRAHVRASEEPSAAAYGARGMCRRCYDSVPREKHPTLAEQADHTLDATRQALESYLNRRRPHRLQHQKRVQETA